MANLGGEDLNPRAMVSGRGVLSPLTTSLSDTVSRGNRAALIIDLY